MWNKQTRPELFDDKGNPLPLPERAPTPAPEPRVSVFARIRAAERAKVVVDNPPGPELVPEELPPDERAPRARAGVT